MRISDWSSDVCSSDLRSAWRRSATLATGWRQGWLANDLKPLLQGSARLRAVRRARIAPASRGGYYRREPAHRCPEDATTMKVVIADDEPLRSEEHTSELQSLMRISYAVFCLKKKTITTSGQH